MKFKILRSKFVEGLKTVQGIVPTKGTLPVLSNVRIECSSGEMTLTTTDLDISIKTVVACEVLEEGATTIPMKLLFNSVSKAAEGEIEVEVDYQDRTTIKAGSAKFKLVGLPESDFPKLPQDEEAYAYQIEQTTWKPNAGPSYCIFFFRKVVAVPRLICSNSKPEAEYFHSDFVSLRILAKASLIPVLHPPNTIPMRSLEYLLFKESTLMPSIALLKRALHLNASSGSLSVTYPKTVLHDEKLTDFIPPR